MKQPKLEWRVEVWRDYLDEDGFSSRTFVGCYPTFAVSEAQAINNVRFRFAGEFASQYLPDEVGGRYEVWYKYKTELL